MALHAHRLAMGEKGFLEGSGETLSPGKDIPAIEFSTVTDKGVVHVIPVILSNGKKRIMPGHKFTGDCCNPAITRTSNGAAIVFHNIIH